MMMPLELVLGLGAGLSFGLTTWQLIVGMRFPLHRRVPDRDRTPGVTVFKPLKGHDSETKDCLRSWLNQDYAGPFQILFGVAAANDPVCIIVESLLAEHPGMDARLIECPSSLGANGKVSTLAQLVPYAQHDVVVISDADVSVPPDLLSNIVPPLDESATGLVCCFYDMAESRNLAMHYEAIAANADFWAQVLQSRSLRPLDFALGAVMATRRDRLDSIGGIATLLDYVADDYELGRRIAAQGKRILLSPIVVECRESPGGWRKVLRHQLRWARTIRVCKPIPYFFSVLSNATFWPVCWLFVSPNVWTCAAAGTFLAWRVVAAGILQHRFTRRPLPLSFPVWVLLKDVLGVAIWGLAFLGNTVEWRGERYRIVTGGKFVRI